MHTQTSLACDLPRMVSATEVMQMYKISSVTLKRLIDRGMLPKPTCEFGRLRRWNLAELPGIELRYGDGTGWKHQR